MSESRIAKPPVATVDEMIDRLGGPAPTGLFFDETPNNICNWRERGIPKTKHLDVYLALKRARIAMAPSLFGRASF